MRRIVVAVVSAVVVVAAAGTGWALTQRAKDTPCEAAVRIVTDIRSSAQADPGAVSSIGGNYGLILRGLVTGDYEDVEGQPSPRLRNALVELADELGVLNGTADAAEFTTGQTGRAIDEVLAACA